MWDAIKKAAGRVLDWGESMLRHGNAIEHILNKPTEQHAILALREHVFGIEDQAEFDRFRHAIIQMSSFAQQSAASAERSWGNCIEDQMAYHAAHIDAGRTSPAVMAKQRVHHLAVMYQLAEGFWAEAQQVRAHAPSPGPTR